MRLAMYVVNLMIMYVEYDWLTMKVVWLTLKAGLFNVLLQIIVVVNCCGNQSSMRVISSAIMCSSSLASCKAA